MPSVAASSNVASHKSVSKSHDTASSLANSVLSNIENGRRCIGDVAHKWETCNLNIVPAMTLTLSVSVSISEATCTNSAVAISVGPGISISIGPGIGESALAFLEREQTSAQALHHIQWIAETSDTATIASAESKSANTSAVAATKSTERGSQVSYQRKTKTTITATLLRVRSRSRGGVVRRVEVLRLSSCVPLSILRRITLRIVLNVNVSTIETTSRRHR